MNQLTHSHQLNPYAIQLCTLGRWVAQRQWLPAGSGLFSIRTSEYSALFTCTDKDKSELNPADLIASDWQHSSTEDTATAIHQFLYQQDPKHKVILQTQGLEATVFSRLIKADQHMFVGYALQHVVAATPAQQHCCPLLILNPQSLTETLQRLQLGFAKEPLAHGFLIRGQGLYVWGDSVDSAKRYLDTWQFLIACELERLKAATSAVL